MPLIREAKSPSLSPPLNLLLQPFLCQILALGAICATMHLRVLPSPSLPPLQWLHAQSSPDDNMAPQEHLSLARAIAGRASHHVRQAAP